MEQEIFKRGSTSYYWASKFFPKHIRQDVFDLYSFVRLADDYVDQVPADKDGFYRLRRLWLEAQKDATFSTQKLPGDTPDERAVKNIVCLYREKGIKKQWIEEFLDTMQSDITFRPKTTLKDSLAYTCGSAEVVGLMMCKVLDLPEAAEETARLQGRAMQWLNFIRDIEEDNQLGRIYFPQEDLKKFGLKDLSKETASLHPERFTKFMHFQIERYKKWQKEAEAGYQYIPKRLLVPIKTAADAYMWTADQIAKDPMIVFTKKVKPGKARISVRILTNMI